MNFELMRLIAAGMLASVLISACGGGGGKKPNAKATAEPAPAWQLEQFAPSADFAQICQTPRAGDDYNDRWGTAMHEKMWLRSWTEEFYLWYDEVDDLDPEPYTVADYFARLKTDEINPLTGGTKDKEVFHFSRPTEVYAQQSQSGVVTGYGMGLASGVIPALSGQGDELVVIVTYVEPGSPADLAGLARGTRIKSVDGISFGPGWRSQVSAIDAGLAPTLANTTHRFVVRDFDAASDRNIEMLALNIELSPVFEVTTHDTANSKVGYILFNTHNQPAEQALIDAVRNLKAEGIDQLVLDLRYNSGGLLYIAAELAYMVSGVGEDGQTIFYRPEFNDKYPTINPFTGQEIQAIPFVSKGLGFLDANESDPDNHIGGKVLPTLALNKVSIIIGDGLGTCSASEAIINGLQGVGVEVNLFGGRTCGKPYGMYGQDNCGTTYFSVQFQGSNALGFGEYPSGFAPVGTGEGAVELAGCSVIDDFAHELGDSNEARLATALEYIETGKCPVQAVALGSSKPSPPQIKFEAFRPHVDETNMTMELPQ